MSCWARCCTAVLLTRRGWSGVTCPPDGWGWNLCCSLCIYRAALAAAIGLSSGAVGVSLVCLIIVGICGQRGAGLYVIWNGPGSQWTFRLCSHLPFGPTSAATWQMLRNDTLLCNHVYILSVQHRIFGYLWSQNWRLWKSSTFFEVKWNTCGNGSVVAMLEGELGLTISKDINWRHTSCQGWHLTAACFAPAGDSYSKEPVSCSLFRGHVLIQVHGDGVPFRWQLLGLKLRKFLGQNLCCTTASVHLLCLVLPSAPPQCPSPPVALVPRTPHSFPCARGEGEPSLWGEVGPSWWCLLSWVGQILCQDHFPFLSMKTQG